MIRLTFFWAPLPCARSVVMPVTAGLLLAALVTFPGAAESTVHINAMDRTATRFNRVIGEIQASIRANNEIADLEKAYFRGETHKAIYLVEDGIRTRDLRGFELQREILRIRLSM